MKMSSVKKLRAAVLVMWLIIAAVSMVLSSVLVKSIVMHNKILTNYIYKFSQKNGDKFLEK